MARDSWVRAARPQPRNSSRVAGRGSKSGIPSAFASAAAQPGYLEERDPNRDVTMLTGYARMHGRSFPGSPRWALLIHVDQRGITAPIYAMTERLGGLWVLVTAPLFVLALDPEANTVTVGPREQLECPGLVTERVNWLCPRPPADGARALVRIRYSHAGGMATLRAAGNGMEVAFDEPQSAVTPGQLAVFYDGDRCLGGAPIARGLGGAMDADSVGAAHGEAPAE